MSIRYHIYREEKGRTVNAVGIADSIEDARSVIKALGSPCHYGLYEHPVDGIPGEFVPVKCGYVIISPAGWLWEPRDSVPFRPHDHWREDGWSIYLGHATDSVWRLCQPDLQKVRSKQGVPPDQIDQVLVWADAEIVKLQGKGESVPS
jgi:hypothetical protein